MAPKRKQIVSTQQTPVEEQEEFHSHETQYEQSRPFLPVHRKQEASSLLLLLFFSILMFTLPFATFYGTRHFLNLYFELDYFQVTCWSVILSVVVVNAIIGLYAYVGYNETEYNDEGEVVKQEFHED